MNTRIEYGYRDGANYKEFGHVVIAGPADDEQIETLRSLCMHEDDDDFFVPESIGWSRLSTGEWDDEIDHPFHTLGDIHPTESLASDERTINEIIAAFRAMDWDEEAVNHPSESGGMGLPGYQYASRPDARKLANIMR